VAHAHGSAWFCPVCSEEAGGIQGYNYKPLKAYFRSAPTEGKVTKDALHMGFEIEIGPKESLLEAEILTHLVKEHVGRDKIYAMEDGSIHQAVGGVGVELASHPFTWEFYKKVGYKDWDKMCLFLKERGWSGDWAGLGTHVHTTKAAWGTHQIYKLLKFIYENQLMVKTIAGRGATQYNSYSHLDPRYQKITAKDKHQLSTGNHYDAINLNNGDTNTVSKTIEFRMFQSRLEPLYFHKNIEFPHACYQFTRAKARMKKSNFISFVRHNQRAYPCLWEVMKEEKICV